MKHRRQEASGGKRSGPKEAGPKGRGARSTEGKRPQKDWPGLDGERLFRQLSGQQLPLSATQLVAEMGLPDASAKAAAALLVAMAREGRLIEARPGRYLVAGADGEYQVEVELGDDGGLQARFTDGTRKPVHPRHRLAAQAGDTAIGVLNNAGQVLLVRLLRRAGQLLLGTLEFRRQEILLIPDRRREGSLPVIGGNTAVLGRYETGDRVVAKVVRDNHGGMAAELLRLLDSTVPEVADFDQVCLMHDLPGPFPDEVRAAAEAIRPDWDPAARRDCREDCVFTIDPDTAKDFDDAICVEQTRNGWKVAVHIADVSHFVVGGELIDEEASLRGTSIYLVNRVIPMLPETLSNGWCSLVPDEERYTLAAFIELDKELNIRSCVPAETLIRSRCRLTYGQAQTMIDSEVAVEDYPEGIVESVRRAHRLAQELRRKRERSGAFNLFSVEHRFRLDVEGQPLEVESEGHETSHQLIEELMLLANRAVATWLDDHHRPCVYRVHGQPDPARLTQFATMTRAYGIAVEEDLSDRFALQRLLIRLEREPVEARMVLNYLCLRCFQKATYNVKNIGHHALAFSHYCHFTSPIRRYPDLLVHRLIKTQLGLLRGDPTLDLDHLDALARQSSFLEQRAENAERDLRSIKAARYLHGRMGEVFAAVVMLPMPAGLQVQLLETGLDGFVPVADLGTDWFDYDSQQMALVGRRSGLTFSIGRTCDVQVIATDIPRGEVTLRLLTGPQPEV